MSSRIGSEDAHTEATAVLESLDVDYLDTETQTTNNGAESETSTETAASEYNSGKRPIVCIKRGNAFQKKQHKSTTTHM